MGSPGAGFLTIAWCLKHWSIPLLVVSSHWGDVDWCTVHSRRCRHLDDCKRERSTLTPPVHVRLCSSVFQDYQFGSSTFLQTSDYEAVAKFPNFIQSFTLTSTALTLNLAAAHTAALTISGRNQFRVVLTQATFSNYNGAGGGCGCGCGCG